MVGHHFHELFITALLYIFSLRNVFHRFVFIIGTSVVLAFRSMQRRRVRRLQLLRKITWRTGVLLMLGFCFLNYSPRDGPRRWNPGWLFWSDSLYVDVQWEFWKRRLWSLIMSPNYTHQSGTTASAAAFFFFFFSDVNAPVQLGNAALEQQTCSRSAIFWQFCHLFSGS